MNIAREKSPGIGSEQKEVLTFYKKLFNYKHIYIFPPITGKTLRPLAAIDRKGNLSFNKAKEIDWLNFYPETFTKESLSGGSSIDNFFVQFDIDAIYPIRQNNECYGFLAVNSHGKPANELESKIAVLVARYIASLWANQDLLNEIQDASLKTERMLAEISSLMEVSKAIESGGKIQGLLEIIMEKCMKVMSVEAVSLLLVTNDRKNLKFRVALGPKGKDIKPYTVKIGQGIAGTVAKTGEPIIIEDAYKDKRFDSSFDEKSGFKTKSILCVPLVFQQKRIGVVQALNRQDEKQFNEHDLRIFSTFASQAALAIQNARLLYKTIEKEKIESQISVASEIQSLIVPEHLPQIKDLEMAGTYIPSQGVGGDFYTVIPLNDAETVFCIADVSGKSIPGALLVSTLHASLKAYLEFTTDLKKVVQKLNDLIVDLSTTDRFITLFIAKYNSEKNKLYYISAGHNPQYIIRNSDYIKLASTGICIGIMEFEFNVTSIDFKKDDILVLYTDGIVEARNARKGVFGEERLEQILIENEKTPVLKVQDIIIKSVKKFAPRANEQDDLTILLVRRK